MSDSLEPPAKRARLDADEDVPGSPIDDMDDDFYDNPTPVQSTLNSLEHKVPVPSSAPVGPVSAGDYSLHLPGLGLLSNGDGQPSSATRISTGNGEEPEDKDVTDSESIYNDVKPSEPVMAAVASEEPRRTDDAPAVPAVPAASAAPQPSNGEAPVENGQKDDVPGPRAPDFDSKTEFLRAAEANKGKADAEWELDSQASDSSTDSSSDDSDDSSEDEEDEDEDDIKLLSPEEQARRLMMEAAEEPEAEGQVRTVNEVTEVFEKPDITVTESTKKTELGKVESVVGNIVVIKANRSGDQQVLESGSALCLADGTVIGKVAETLGRVQEPRYSVGFTDAAEIGKLGITKDETTIYYVDEHSTFVDTEPLKAQEWTDASNIHDEEADHVEFSDDEKEMQYKRNKKASRKGKNQEQNAAENGAKNEGRGDGHNKPQNKPNNDVPTAPKAGQYSSGGLNYGDDDDDDLGMYKPLARPDHYEDIVGAGAPLEDRSHVRRGNMRGRGGWPDRGRGFRGRGGGGAGGGGGQAGGRGNQRGNQRGGGRFAGVPTGPQAQSGSGAGDRGGRHAQESNRGRNYGPNHGPNHGPKENRPGASASPGRRNRSRHGHGHGQGQQQSPRGKGRQGRNASSPPAASASPAPPPNANSYTQNAALNSNAWAVPPNASGAPQVPFTSYAAPQAPQAPPIPAGAYVNPAFYSQAAAAAAPPPQAAPQQQPPQQQANLAQWAQWIQLAAAMQNQGLAQTPTPPQPQPQYSAPAAPAPAYNVPAAAPQQQSTPSLQDILRTLGGGAPPQNR
jgi:H/ACA ribonucleoprotein complex non-core subunit NAF1